MLERESDDTFDINDTQPFTFTLNRLDPPKTRLVVEKVTEDHPLYYIIKFLKITYMNFKEKSVVPSLEAIQQVCEHTLQKLENTKWTVNKSNVSTFVDHIDYMNGCLNSLLAEKSHFRLPLSESMARILSALEKNVQVKSGQTFFQRTVGTLLSDMLVSIGIFHFQAGHLQIAEAYCVKHLTHLDTLPKFNLEDINKRKSAAQLILARIYLKRGESQLALDFLRTVYSNLDHHYYSESIYNLPDFVALYKEILCYFYKGDISQIFNLYQSFLKMEALVKAKHTYFSVSGAQGNHALSSDFLKAMQKDVQFIHLIFAQTKQKYPEQFNQAIAHSPILKKIIDKVDFNFNSYTLTLTFKDILLKYLIQAFKAKKIPYTNDSEKCFTIDIGACSTKKLERVCQYALQQHTDYLTHQAEQLRAKEVLAQSSLRQPTMVSTALENEVIPIEMIISSPEATSNALTTPQEETKPRSRSATHKEKTVKGKRQQSICTTKNKPIQSVRYEWPCGQVYDSNQHNQGQVKQLTNPFLPDNLWFGYIPDELKDNEHYNKEFEQKLTRGLIAKDCIRYIVKELRTKAIHNDATEHPYKFKIVVKNQDYRVYGWIEDVMTDDEERKHYLVCFGFLGNHKLEQLPDPNIIRKQYIAHAAVEQKAPEQEIIIDAKQLINQPDKIASQETTEHLGYFQPLFKTNSEPSLVQNQEREDMSSNKIKFNS